ncbi:MAG: ABC transporter ATP-binding protein [Atopobiaceae bacterium]|nr:ABC transporter ATP-binding protein [Atopobiaceae bacterium]
MVELLRRFLAGYRVCSLVAVLTKMIEVVFELLTPFVVAAMIDAAQAGAGFAQMGGFAAVLIGFALASYASTLVCQYLAAGVSQGVGTKLRDAIYEASLRLSPEQVDRFGASSLLTRTTADVNQVQLAIALTLRQVTRWPVLVVGSIIAAVSIDRQMGVVFAICLPVVVVALVFVMRVSVPLLMKMQAGLDRLSLLMRESLSGVRTIRAFRKDAFERARFDEATHTQARMSVLQGRISALLNPASFVAMGVGLIAIVVLGGRRVYEGSLTTGEVVAFVSYMTQALSSIAFLASLVMVLMRAHTSSVRILEVLQVPAQVQGAGLAVLPTQNAAPPNAATIPTQNSVLLPTHNPAPLPTQNSATPATQNAALPTLVLDKLSFSFAGAQKPAIDKVSLTLEAGHTLGVIGGTGSGKSALTGLIAGLYQPSSGILSICGVPTEELSEQKRSAWVSFVPQESSLVSGTIRSNLCWRDVHATDEELWQALRDAQAADFVRALELQLDAPVEAHGKNFSGGQRQRLCIARALVGDARLVVLDDATSALDYATDAALRQALYHGARSSKRQNVSYVIISQRISSLMEADEILVLDHGRCCGLGTHDELLKSCLIYREICELQLGAREVCHG